MASNSSSSQRVGSAPTLRAKMRSSFSGREAPRARSPSPSVPAVALPAAPAGPPLDLPWRLEAGERRGERERGGGENDMWGPRGPHHF
jgi:hypothetical protein